jgi:hypothetical protein
MGVSVDGLAVIDRLELLSEADPLRPLAQTPAPARHWRL